MLLLPLLLSALARLPSSPEAAVMPLSEVKEGMVGVGHSVFQGDRIEEFRVEILGVLENAGAGRSTILARLSGGQLAQSGVVAGMSGSPVYVGGKLLGAVSSTYAYAKEPIAGITPIQEMLDLQRRDWTPIGGPPVYLSAGALATRLLEVELGVAPELLGGPPAEGGASQPIVPVVVAGADPRTFARAAGFFRGLGLAPMQGAARGTAGGGGAAGDLAPGSPVAIELIRGDLGIAAFGTVTTRRGDEVLAFGHPLFNAGTVDLPLATAQVIGVMPSLVSSFKMCTVGRAVGSLVQDRTAGVLGRIGVKAPMIPLQLGIKRGSNPMDSFAFELALHRLLTPQLVEMSLLSAMQGTEKLVGASSLKLDGVIRVAGHEPVVLNQYFTGDQAAAGAVGLVSAVTQVLIGNEFGAAHIDGLSLTVDYLEDTRFGAIERVWVDRTRVRPGDGIRVKAFLKQARGGEALVETRVTVPGGIAPGPLELTVGDGSAMARLEARSQRYVPKSLGQIIDLVNRLRRGDAVHAMLSRPDNGVVLKGTRMAALPPSAFALLAGVEAGDGLLPLKRLVLDETSAAIPFAAQGIKTIKIQVDSR